MGPETRDGATTERLQKVLARAGVASRREAEELIREGRVTVDGVVAEVGRQVDPDVESIKVDGRRIQRSPRRRYVLVNKPLKVVSTLKDPEGRKTVIDLVPTRLHRGLVPVGRLDFDSEGLLLLTDDGDLAHRIAHPRYGCRKVYEVKVKGRPSESAIGKLSDGIVIEGKRTAPATIQKHAASTSGGRNSVSNSWWRVELGEGRTRQIREMFFRIGHPVNRLRRVAIGPLRDTDLPVGGWRELTEDEVAELREATAKTKKRETRRPARTARKAQSSAEGTGRGRGGAAKARRRSTGRAQDERAGSKRTGARSGPSRGGSGRGRAGAGKGRTKPGGDRGGSGRGGSGRGGSGRGGSGRGGGGRRG